MIHDVELDVKDIHNAFHASLIVFGLQLLMFNFVCSVIMSDAFVISLPSSVSVMGARFIACILMHLQVEGDIGQGIRMMKYVTNQPFDFINPGCAFFVAFMQTVGGLLAELACILFLGSIDNPLLIIISFVGLASLSKVDDIYFSSLPVAGNKILKATMPLVVKVHLRDWEAYANLAKDPNLAKESIEHE